jgi:tRNA(Ile)-lysidine synthase
MADVRRVVRESLASAFPDARARVTRDPSCGAPGGWVAPADAPLVLVALSGGPDSLGLAAALAFEATKCGVKAGAVIVDHGLQLGSEAAAQRAAEHARSLGLAPVVVERVTVADSGAGPEADAREARYSAFDRAAREAGALAVLLGHTRDDQAETVLLGLARGSGARSVAGMRELSLRGDLLVLRPLLNVARETVTQSCLDMQLDPWIDPHNSDARFSRVRVRTQVLPVLEREIGPGVAEALARTASLLAMDADALDALAANARMLARRASALDVVTLQGLQPAVRTRVIRIWLADLGASDLTSSHIDAVDALITDWSGQEGIDVPGLRVSRSDGRLFALDLGT